jgi:hypothetical protein
MAGLAGRPRGKHSCQLAGPVSQALGAGAEGVDEGAVLGAEVAPTFFVRPCDRGRQAAQGVRAWRRGRRPAQEVGCGHAV